MENQASKNEIKQGRKISHWQRAVADIITNYLRKIDDEMFKLIINKYILYSIFKLKLRE